MSRIPNTRTCTICGGKEFARGWCHKHWNRWRRHGDPNHVEVIMYDPLARLMSYVKKIGGCWMWQGQQHTNAYGRTSIGGKKVYPHRLMYELMVGPIPKGLTIDHTCDTPLCVRPEHLEPVTRAENIRRAHARRKS